MQYEQTNEKVTMMDDPPVVVTRPLSMTEDPQIQRIRKYLLIIVGVFLAPYLIFIILLIALQIFSSNDQVETGTSWGWIQFLVPVIFYSFGIFVAYRYSATGLRVFAWSCIVLPILAGIAILIGIFISRVLYAPIRVSSSGTENDKAGSRSTILGLRGSIGQISDLIILTAVLGLTILKIVLAFKLARLIDAKTSLAIQQI